jgi:hypothetical protein
VTPIDNLAPYPATEEDATAEKMAAHFAALAHMSGRIALKHRDPTVTAQAYDNLGIYYGMASFLRALAEHAGPGIADKVALGYWQECRDSIHISSDLDEWLREYGIRPEQVDAVTDHAVKAEIAAQAGTESAA